MTETKVDASKESLFKLLGRVSGGDINALKEAAKLFAINEKQLTATQQKLDVAVEALKHAELILKDNVQTGFIIRPATIVACNVVEAALNTIRSK